ncbi:MAG: hypothetical protein B7Z47_00975 [Chthoniobacter sp. 12-60-6]|nr:MAG: hypothetical protein B7Z47_00975 [Chthoniobacter sp. 12-60-6]
MNEIRSWLERFSWDFVVAQNAVLCQAKNALHKPTSDGFDATKALWETRHAEPMNLMEAVDLCRQCHRMAPFCFYNGNTFAAIARSMVDQVSLAAAEAAVLRSLTGHIVAGVATPEQIESFRKFCERSE